MIDKLIDYCARHRLLVFILVVAATFYGIWSLGTISVDAIPDLSDTQVIVFARWDRSPDIIEDQVTYPIVSALLGLPKVKDIRGFSDFGYAYIYAVFEDGTDLYWARARTLEYLSSILPRLPEGVKVELARDATAVGWVFQYALVDRTGRHDLAQLRSLQDWYLRYYLQSVPGVAEVAPVGGFVRQYQVNIDPHALTAHRLSLEEVVEAIRRGNSDVGARLLEFSGREYMVRGRGYIRSVADVENVVVMANRQSGTPVLVRHLGNVVLGPDLRRGVSDLDGEGEAVGGIVVMRFGENALEVIQRVKAKLEEIRPGLPEGVEVLTTYDRSDLILRSINTLRETLVEEMLIVALVILLFLWRLPSALFPVLTIPIAIVVAFIPMRWLGVSANIMSLGGIAVAIGAMVDAAIVGVEQAHKKLEDWEQQGKQGSYREVVIAAIKEVGGPSFFALLVIAVSFLPVFALEGQEGRLFRPLAFTKNLSMLVAAVLAVTLGPALLTTLMSQRRFQFRPGWLCRGVNALLVGKIHPEESHPISRVLMRVYHPFVDFVLRHPYATVLAAVLMVAATVPVFQQLGSEFMPPLDEGTLLFMPTTLPGLSVTEASALLQTQDQIIRTFPEVERVFGKAGRAEAATDPAPFSMIETVIVLRPKEEWRPVARWYSDWAPEWVRRLARPVWPDHISLQELIYGPGGLNEALTLPGVSNAWTMPIKGRIDMLTTGVRTPVGVKIMGADLEQIERIGAQVEQVLQKVPGTASVFAERTAGGYFLDFQLDRQELARYGLSVDAVQNVLMSAVGGENVTTTVEGRERYGVNVRYQRDYRSSMDSLRRVLVTDADGRQIPMAQLANLQVLTGPAMIRNENGLLSGYVYVDVAGRDLGSYVTEARRVVRESVALPPGYALAWSGQYEYMERANAKLAVVVPVTLLLIFLLLYFNTGSGVKTGIILLAVPFSAIGAVWLLYLLDYDMSVAVWVGLIALLGIDAETGVFMLMYLDLAFKDLMSRTSRPSLYQLRQAILTGAVKRLRPKVMTVSVTFLALFPIMWSTGTGADVMKRIAAPLIGGVFTSFLLELLVYPAVYQIWRWDFQLRRSPKEVQ